MLEKLRRPESAVFFWILMVAILAVVVASFWFVIVDVAIPVFNAVRDAYF
ncbi:hypothetical protein [Arthrobacter sp. NPDC056727]